MLSRRQLLALSAAAAALRCATKTVEVEAAAHQGRLNARPAAAAESNGAKGLRRLANGFVYVPDSYEPDRAAPLIVVLHGAGGGPESMLRLMRPHADRIGAIVIVPQAVGRTWDIIERRSLGPDVQRINDLLAVVFAHYNVDPKRVCVSGFSDGASYALTLGIGNGDLFTHVIAFSPGFMSGRVQHGASRYFISHGTRDQVLPVDRCGRHVSAELKRAGFDVQYREFDGPHTVPDDIATAAIRWFAGA